MTVSAWQTETTDVLVVGGGPAGVCAAISSARAGARTLLVERLGYLGGVATASLFQPWRGFHVLGKQLQVGIGEEIARRLQVGGGSPGHLVDPTGTSLTVTPFDPTKLKAVLQEMAVREGVSLRFQTRGRAVDSRGGVIEGIRSKSPVGDILFRAGVYIDATGIGELAAAVGARSVVPLKGASFRFIMTGVDERALLEYAAKTPHEFSKVSAVGGPYLSVKGFTSISKEWYDGSPSVTRSDSIRIEGTTHAGEVVVSMIELPNVDPDDPGSLERADLRCRDLAARGAEFLVRHLPGFGRARLLAVGEEIGFHAARQILGEEHLSDSDILSGRTFRSFCVTCALPGRPEGTFEIPVGALRIPKCRNLFVAGRAVLPQTALFETNSQVASMQMGEVAGKLAAESAGRST